MKAVTRERFVDQFAITIQVHCLPMWGKRRKEAPTFLTRSMFEAIRMCGGEIPLESERAFADIVAPAIVELHRITPNGTRPEARELTGRVYDALNGAGVEVTIAPPVKSGPTPEGRGYRG